MTSGERPAAIPAAIRDSVQVLWDYHDLRHELRPTDVGIGLGSHDLAVATCAAILYRRGLYPRIVFTGANAPTTIAVLPRGEAVHYREHALALGVPDAAILVEPQARNTGENITLARDLLRNQGHTVRSAILISRPYQQRQTYATCRKLWPEVTVQCASLPLTLDDYVATIGERQPGRVDAGGRYPAHLGLRRPRLRHPPDDPARSTRGLPGAGRGRVCKSTRCRTSLKLFVPDHLLSALPHPQRSHHQSRSPGAPDGGRPASPGKP